MSNQTALSDRDKEEIWDTLRHAVANAAGKNVGFYEVDAEVASISDREDGLVGWVKLTADIKILMNPRYDDILASPSPFKQQLAYEGWEVGELTPRGDGSVSITVWESDT